MNAEVINEIETRCTANVVELYTVMIYIGMILIDIIMLTYFPTISKLGEKDCDIKGAI